LTAGVRGQAQLIDTLQLRNRPQAVPVYKYVGAELDVTHSFNPSVQAAPATLHVTHGQALFVIGPQRRNFTIGRQGPHDIRIDHTAVSRLHAEILVRGDKFILADHSTNGTFVHAEDGFVLRLLREELTLSGSGRIVAAVDAGPPILFRVVEGMTRP
jgi:hypothetical protein